MLNYLFLVMALNGGKPVVVPAPAPAGAPAPAAAPAPATSAVLIDNWRP